jgi:hypothetical protein
MYVLRKSPRKSSKLCPYGEDAAESRIKDYKLPRLRFRRGSPHVVNFEESEIPRPAGENAGLRDDARGSGGLSYFFVALPSTSVVHFAPSGDIS